MNYLRRRIFTGLLSILGAPALLVDPSAIAQRRLSIWIRDPPARRKRFQFKSESIIVSYTIRLGDTDGAMEQSDKLIQAFFHQLSGALALGPSYMFSGIDILRNNLMTAADEERELLKAITIHPNNNLNQIE